MVCRLIETCTLITSVDRLIGYHGDLNATYPVGNIDDESKKLIRTTRQCLDDAIKLCKPGALFRDLGKTM